MVESEDQMLKEGGVGQVGQRRVGGQQGGGVEESV